MKVKSLILTLWPTLVLVNCGYSQRSTKFSQLDSLVTKHMSENHVPGLALAIVKNGRVIKKEFYGTSNIEKDIPVSNSTVFEIASMTKQITCAAILLLQESGRLSVKDFLSKYLSNLPPTWKDITLEELMNHTSGIRDDWDEPTSYFFQNYTDVKMVEAQKKYPLYFKPGEGFNYSSGPFFLGLIIEKITKRHFSFFFKENIFNPLQMFSTSVYDSTSIPANLAIGYRWNNSKLEEGIDIPPSAESRADVGILTTIDDMIKWNNALNDTRLLRKESIQAMFEPGKLKDGHYIPYGYGWYIYYFRNKLIFEHGGAFRTGFNSRISKFLNSDLDIIILSNKWKAGLSDLTYELAYYYNHEFKRISTLQKETDEINNETKEVEKLFYDLSVKKFNRGQLYRQINISGFDPGELEDMFKGFKKVESIGKLTLQPKSLKLYGSKITKVLYFKIISDNPTYWSLTYNVSGKLVSANLED